MTDKKKLIANVIAFILGLIGGYLGKDLSSFQKPAEEAVITIIEKDVKIVEPVSQAEKDQKPVDLPKEQQ